MADDKIVLTDKLNPKERITVPRNQAEEYLGITDASGNQRYSTAGTLPAFDTDKSGKVIPKQLSTEEIFKRRSRGRSGFLAVGDDARHEQLRSQFEDEERRRIAEETRGTEFVRSAANVATAGISQLSAEAILRAGGTSQEEIDESLSALQAAKGGEKIAGQVFGAAVSLLAPGVGAFGAGKVAALTGGQAARIPLRQAFTARGLLGFHKGLATNVASKVAARGVGPRTANVIGRVATAPALDVPLSLQFQAANIVDGNKPATGEAILAQAGIDSLIGMGLEAAFPILGAVGRGVKVGAGKIGDTAIKFPVLAQVLTGSQKVGTRVRVAREIRGATRGKSGGLAQKLGLVRNPAKVRNSAMRATVSESAEKQLRDLQTVGDAANNLRPSRFDQVNPQAFDNAAKLVGGENVGAARMIDGRGGMIAAQKATGQMSREAKSVGDTMVNSLDSKVSPQRLKAAEITTPAKSAVRATLTDMGREITQIDAAIGKEIEALSRGLTEKTTGSKYAATLFELRNKWLNRSTGLKDAAKDRQIFQVIRERTDALLSNRDLFPKDHIRFRQLLTDSGSMELLSQEIRSLDSTLRGMDNLLDLKSMRLAEIKGAIESGRAAARNLADAGLAPKGLTKKLDSAGTKLGELLDTHTKGLDDLTAMNRMRQETLARLDLPPQVVQQATPQSTVLASYEAVRDTLRGIDDVIEKRIVKATPVARAAVLARGGVFAVRGENREVKTEAYKEVASILTRLSSRPERLTAHIGNGMAKMAQADFDTAVHASVATARAVSYLQATLPPAPFLYADERAVPNLNEIDAFFERYGAVLEPVSVLEAVAEGTVSSESIETLEVVYPELYSTMQLSLIEGLRRADGDKMSYSRKRAIDQFLGGGVSIDSDPIFWSRLADPAPAQAAGQPAGGLGPLPAPHENQLATANTRLEAL